MELIDAIKTRHAVRKYTDKPIEASIIATLRSRIESLNGESGLARLGIRIKQSPGSPS